MPVRPRVTIHTRMTSDTSSRKTQRLYLAMEVSKPININQEEIEVTTIVHFNHDLI